jgi:uncharacterized membrane protein
MPDRRRTDRPGLLDQLPTDRLVEQGQQLLFLLAEQAIERAAESVEGLAERLLGYAQHGGAQHGGPGLIAAITGGRALAEAKLPLSATVKARATSVCEGVKQARQALAGVSVPRRSGQATKAMNIVEQIDVGVPVRLAYDQWTRFQDFSQFMKTVSAVEKTSDVDSSWKVQILWSDRDWDATIIEQIPDERIVWRSEGGKGHVDGIVSFHAMTPNMTRILLALEYYPRGLLERAGNIWHIQVRRVRLEIRQFRYHVMARVALDPESVLGWRGEIRDGKVVRTHEEAIANETRDQGKDPERAEVSGTSFEDDSGTVADAAGDTAEEDDNYDDDSADDPAGENDDYENYENTDDTYDDAADEEYEEYDDEPEREYVPSGRR